MLLEEVGLVMKSDGSIGIDILFIVEKKLQQSFHLRINFSGCKDTENDYALAKWHIKTKGK